MSAKFRCARLVGVTGALVLLGFALPAQAIKQGDWLVRAGAGYVSPNDSSGDISGAPGAKVGVDSGTSLAFTVTYMLRDNLGIELLGALPFKHDITGQGTLSGAGKVAEVKHVPPTLMLAYHFAPQASTRPYAGVGVNYTKFIDEKTTGALAGTSISLSSSTGLAAEAGVDIDINPDWFFNASIWYIDINTTASTALGSVDVEIDPWVLMVGVGKRF